MLKELYAVLGETFFKQNQPIIQEINEELLLVQTRESITQIPKLPPARKHQVETFDSFIDAVTRWGKHGVIWHDVDGIHLVCNDEGQRRDDVTLQLEHSPEWQMLAALQNKADQQIAQRTLLKILTRNLNGCVPESVIKAIRVIEFKRGTSGVAAIDRGKETLGRSIEAQVNNAENIPEEFLASVPIYVLPELSQLVDIKMFLDINVENETFCCAPAPGALDKAVDAMQVKLHELLQKSVKVNVFQGRD